MYQSCPRGVDSVEWALQYRVALSMRHLVGHKWKHKQHNDPIMRRLQHNKTPSPVGFVGVVVVPAHGESKISLPLRLIISLLYFYFIIHEISWILGRNGKSAILNFILFCHRHKSTYSIHRIASNFMSILIFSSTSQARRKFINTFSPKSLEFTSTLSILFPLIIICKIT